MMLKASRFLLVMLVCTVAFAGRPARADSTPEALVEKARLTFESLYNDKDYTQLRKNMKLAKAVLIIPSELKGAFIVGAAGGSGVLVAKDENGAWGYPAFYTVGSGSLGFQIGFQNSEAVFVIMTEKGLHAIINNQVKLGVDLSVAIGPVGQGMSGSTTTAAGADIVAFSRTTGLFAGGSLDGAAIVKRDDWNTAFYGQGATPTAIIFDKKFSNPKADPLRQALQAAQ
ncbi:MAG TPA: lipid-binding SYLF domain-containing protein [Alphaproteobacteria bacterium]|nr:lipid-binding SYLF domain-containing protein [Alphaproteobacteria bacterium]